MHRCDALDRAPGHTRTIYTGEDYVRVSIRPEEGGGRWVHLRLCTACASASYELIEAVE